jgi:uracil-DNA glycosylase
MPKFNITRMFKGVDKRWIRALTSSELMPLLSKALDALGDDCDIDQITPKPNDIFNFARATPYEKIKVVILGQDPYPKTGEAHGLAFSSLGTKVPASLRNIYKCLYKQGQIDSLPTTSDLSYWAEQGVLLLNASLTTRIGKSNAHSNIWKEFTDALIEYISCDDTCGPCPSLTFLLWGAHAQKKKCLIGEDCVIYTWLHPSPLAQGGAGDDDKFIECDHFEKVNDLLINSMYLKPICWDPTPTYVIYTDGSCSNNGKGVFSRAGYSAYFAKGPISGVVKYGSVPTVILNGAMVYGTNQRGEGLGIITALESVLQYDGIKKNIKVNTTIVTDSDFWKKMVESYMPNWEMRGTDFKLKKNHDLTTRMHLAAKNVMDLGVLTIIHVASHDKDPNAPPEHVSGNRIADKYANDGKLMDSPCEQTLHI